MLGSFSFILACASEPTIDSGIEKPEIKKVIGENVPAFKACYEGSKTAILKEGRLTLKWEINEFGMVENAEILKTEIKDPEFESCLKDVLSKCTFPTPKSGTFATVHYPFVFTVSGN